MSRWVYLLAVPVMIVALSLSGCGNGHDKELKKYTDKVKTRKPRPVKALPTYKEPKQFGYPETVKRNPFRPTVQRRQGPQPDLKRKRGPLEAYPLDALRLVGTLSQSKRKWALVLVPTGAVHQVKQGDYIGQNHGKVVKVGPESVKVQETFAVGENWEQREALLKLVTGNGRQ